MVTNDNTSMNNICAIKFYVVIHRMSDTDEFVRGNTQLEKVGKKREKFKLFFCIINLNETLEVSGFQLSIE